MPTSKGYGIKQDYRYETRTDAYTNRSTTPFTVFWEVLKKSLYVKKGKKKKTTPQ